MPQDMMFDNIVLDMMAKKKIETALRQVDSMRDDARHAERWLEGWWVIRDKDSYMPMYHSYFWSVAKC